MPKTPPMNTKIFAWPVALAVLALATPSHAQPCPTTVMLTAPIAGSGVVEQAGSHLVGANRVESGEVSYRAGQSVTLTPAFGVKAGAVFEASIAACEALPAREEGGENALTLTAYPNPFARSVLIEYELPEATMVGARITNIRGVTVSRLLAGEPQTEGTHWLTFESESLPEGVYLCVLDTSRGRRTLQIVKQK